ncbi:hypothetical protein SH501x_002790 [Pirellulaceae bacterium SH501]
MSKPDTTVTQTGADTASLLAAADALDGKVDKVVQRCYVCNLGMNGKQSLAVKHAGYTAHLCSEGCKDEFASNTESIIANTKIPAK